MRAIRVAVIVQERQLLGCCRRALLPEHLDRFVINALAQLIKDDPGQFTIPKPRVEPFEPSDFLDHGLWHPSTSAWGDHLDGGREQAQHPLLLEATLLRIPVIPATQSGAKLPPHPKEAWLLANLCDDVGMGHPPSA
jgi:hypothetical protein